MVVREPTPDEVRGFLEFAGLSDDDAPLAVRALKQGNHDVSQLVMEFYDDAEAFRKKYSWDESAFSSGRDGAAGSDGPSSFHIESIPEETDSQVLHGVNPGQDTTYYGQPAPSRPPTRTMNRSPLGRAIDLTSANIPGPSPADEEDEDLKRALMESANEAGLDAPPPQTSGVVSGYEGSPAFGPATREQYDMNQWALVRQDTSQDTSTSSVPPSSRKRDPTAPVLLLNDSSTMEQRLGSLLTILHEISLARNTLLQLGAQEAGYGHNGEWWTGKPIVPPHLTDANSLEEVVVFEEEVHRLLGFLESTDRSFGSTRVLSELLLNSWDQDESFFVLLLEKHGVEGMGPFLHEARSFQIGPPDTEHREEDCDMAKMGYFKFTLTEDSHRNTTSLYDVLDYQIWKQTLEECLYSDLEQQHMSLFSDMGDIIVMTVVDPFRSTKFEIPQSWYPERYLWSRKKEAIGIQWLRRRMRAGMREVEEKLAPPGGESLPDRLKRTEVEVGRCDLLLGYLNARPRFRALEQSGFDGKTYPNGAADAPWNPTVEEQASLDDILGAQKDAVHQCEKLKAEIQELETEMERYRAYERFVGRLLTDPDRERPREFGCKKFSLRGIGTSKDTVYVCRRSETPLIDLGDAPEPRDQWWRLEHTASREQPVKAEKLDFEAIQLRASEESNTVTLVFATEEAVSAPRAPLSDALTHFIKADNRGFQKELEQEEAGADEPQHEVRAFRMRSRAGSVDSMASNRASVGSAGSRGEEFVHEIHPDQLPDSDATMDVDEAPRGGQGEGEAGGVEGGGGGEEGDAEMQEMEEVSAKPIFVAGQDRPPPLPERK